jgi:hypothetical protein
VFERQRCKRSIVCLKIYIQEQRNTG